MCTWNFLVSPWEKVTYMYFHVPSTVKLGYERIAFPDIFQTGVQSRSLARGTTRFLLEDFLAVLQLVELDIEALPNRADPCIADKRQRLPS